jgi:hypothetical protein
MRRRFAVIRRHLLGKGSARLSDPVLVRPSSSDRISARHEEAGAHRKPGRKAAAIRTTVFVTVIVVLLAIPVFALIGASEHASETPPRQPATAAPSPEARTGPEPAAVDGHLPGFGVHVNEEAGYLFSYPDAWTVSSSGTRTRLLGPNGDVEMTFDIAPSPALDAASDQIVAGIAGSYSNVELITSEGDRTPQGYRSLVVGARATDAAGDAVRFLVITIRGSDQTRAITVRFDAESDPLDSLSVIRQIVASFRTSESG